MPGFCTSIGFVFTLGVELFDYVVDGGNLRQSGWASQMGDMASRWRGSNP